MNEKIELRKEIFRNMGTRRRAHHLGYNNKIIFWRKRKYYLDQKDKRKAIKKIKRFSRKLYEKYRNIKVEK